MLCGKTVVTREDQSTQKFRLRRDILLFGVRFKYVNTNISIVTVASLN